MGRTEAAYAEDELPQAPARRARSGPPASSAATARRRSTPTTAAPSSSAPARRPPASPPAASRTACRSPTTAGSCTSAAATAAPTPSAARLLGLPSLGRILDHANPNVGIGCGSVHIFDPAQYTGAENSGVTRAGTLAVYGDGGQGGERTNEDNHKMEYGLLGIVADPDFSAERPRLPAVLPDLQPAELAARPAGRAADLEDVASRASRASRSTCRPSSSTCSSERIIFKYDAQIFSCCHVGGGMGFDSEGNLYVTTGDTNSSQGTNGYSGNNPIGKCPIGPADAAVERALRRGELLLPGRAPHGGQHQRLQRQDAAVPAAGGHRGRDAARRRAHLRAADRGVAERPEPVQGRPRARRRRHATRTKPEIYAMGLRNPSRLSIDPETDIAVHGVGRPGRRQPERDAGPVDLRERGPDLARRQLWLAVLHGLQAGLPRPPRATAACAPTARRATCPAVPPPAAPRAGTTATTCATTRRTTPA